MSDADRDLPAPDREPVPLPRRLLVAVALSAAACALTTVLGEFMARNIFMLVFTAVAAASLAGGRWAGLTATAVTAGYAAYALLAPVPSLRIHATEDAVRLAVYAVVGVSISFLGDALRKARRRAAAREAALRESRARFRGVVEHLAEGVALLDLEGRLVYANPRMSELVEGGVSGEGWASLMAAAAPGRWDAQRERPGGGGPMWLVGHTRPFRDAEGREVGTLHVLRDVTAQREAQAALAASEEMRRHSQKMEAVGRVAGGIAHDFNNLLAAIRLSASLLRMDVPAGSEAAESVTEIDEAVARATALVRQILSFSRPQALELRPVDLNAAVAGVRRMLGRLVPPEVEVVTVPADEPAMVMADPVQLDQVLLNLGVNARDAMPRGGRLTLSVHRPGADVLPQPDGRAGWWLAVADTGVGMDAATLQKVFEPFFTTKESKGGTGLGLATVYGIVQQSGGELQVTSVPGEGTTFHVFLPAPAPDEPASAADASAA